MEHTPRVPTLHVASGAEPVLPHGRSRGTLENGGPGLAGSLTIPRRSSFKGPLASGKLCINGTPAFILGFMPIASAPFLPRTTRDPRHRLSRPQTEERPRPEERSARGGRSAPQSGLLVVPGVR